MPIRDETELVLGRGEVFFEPFLPGTRQGDGERYIGNTTTFQVGREIERLSRFTSYRGQRVEQPGTVISEKHSINFTTDHIHIDNVALWYGDEPDETSVPSAGSYSENLTVRRGRFYQLGKAHIPVVGVRNVEQVRVFAGSVEIQRAGNWDVENDQGRLQILPGPGPISDGLLLTIQYEWRTSVSSVVRSQAAELHGALRFVAFNPFGSRKQYYFPHVRISPRGMVDLKGDEWQQFAFEASCFRLSPSIEQVYVSEAEAVLTTSDEQAIIDEGIPLSDFPYWDEQLDEIVNGIMGSRGYSDAFLGRDPVVWETATGDPLAWETANGSPLEWEHSALLATV